MIYKNYIGKVVFDEAAGFFHGEVINTKDVITFQGHSVKELKKAFKDSIEDYLEFCTQRNELPDSPFTGVLTLQIPFDKQKQIHDMALKDGKDINSYILDNIMLKAI